MLKELDIAAGILTAAAGFAGTLIFLFSPINGTPYGPQSPVQTGLGGITIAILVLVSVSVAGVAVGSYLANQDRGPRGLAILIVSAMALLLLTVASGGGGAYFFAPALLLAIVTLGLALVRGVPGLRHSNVETD